MLLRPILLLKDAQKKVLVNNGSSVPAAGAASPGQQRAL